MITCYFLPHYANVPEVDVLLPEAAACFFVSIAVTCAYGSFSRGLAAGEVGSLKIQQCQGVDAYKYTLLHQLYTYTAA